MCLHWNYYNPPIHGQEAPMATLGPGDRAFRAFREEHYDEEKWKEAMGITGDVKGLSVTKYACHHRHIPLQLKNKLNLIK